MHAAAQHHAVGSGARALTLSAESATGLDAETSAFDEARANQAFASIEALLADAVATVRTRVSDGGRLSPALIEREQRAAHGLAWLATYVSAAREMIAYARRMRREQRFGPAEALLTAIGLGEFLAQIFGGIPMSQGEIVRPGDFGLGAQQIAARRDGAAAALIEGNNPANRRALADLLAAAHSATFGDPGLDDTLDAIRAEMRLFAEAEIAPLAQKWHRDNAYIPLDVIRRLAEMGVFGLTIPEAYGGTGLGKV
ncbi:MAG TPA: acyl-CoA dehydrogenase family protein, partial [Roseiarcus sp.]|nr:acyl-CoA dehydrogenase family protein [Roseiarcus sp.]